MEEYVAEVVGITNYPASGSVQARTIRLRVPHSFSFVPGQFVMVGHAAVKNRAFPEKLKWASMSIANSPAEKGVVELGMDVGEEGGVRHFVCTQLKQGDSLIMKGPMGRFVLEEKPHEPVFVALGTGITPIMSMARFFCRKNPKTKAVLFYSIKNSDLFLFEKELSQLQLECPSLELVVSVTRDDVRWKGKRGRLQQHFAAHDFGDTGEKIVYICGSPKSTIEIIASLLSLGFSEAQIRKEQW